MNARKFLSTLGRAVVNAAGIVTGVGPILGPIVSSVAHATPTKVDDAVVDTLAKLRGIVEAVEVFGQSAGVAGPDKAKAAGPLVAQVFLSSSAFAGHTVANEAEFKAACVDIAAGVARAMNALDDSRIGK